MLTIYHLKSSRSTRIVWLAEELGLDYKLEVFDRESDYSAPAAYKALASVARAPMIRDGDVTLGESGAIIEYLITRHGRGRLMPKPESPDYPDYLYWLHFAEGSAMQHLMVLRMLDMAGQNDVSGQTRDGMKRRAAEDLKAAEQVLAKKPWLAGEAITGADINMASALGFGKDMVDPELVDHPHVAAYLARIAERPAYQQALRAG